uniref:Carnosine synthase 1 n=1 Tax=Xenopus tropicalis TaxID=8364 RepID=A0A803K2R7_XENTR
MISLDQLIMDHSNYSKDRDINEVWVPGMAPDGPPWCKRPQETNKEKYGIENNSDFTSAYSNLQNILINASLPETEDRTKHPRTGHTADTTTICVLGDPSFAMSVLLEGARQCPGNILLCLSPSCFHSRPENSGLPSPLFVRQAVSFDLGGRTFLDNFYPPRRVTYLFWLGGEQILLEGDIECPMGGSPQLSCFLADTLGIRLLLDSQELPLPPALILTPFYQQGLWEPLNGEGKTTRMVKLDREEGWEEKVKKDISEFLAFLKTRLYQKVVCTIGRAEKPLHHRFALPQSLETTLELWGITDKSQKEDIWVQVKNVAEQTMRVVIDAEKKMTSEERGGWKAQTDILGVDFLLTVVDYTVTPVIIGVTADLCLETCGIQECLLGYLAASGPIPLNSATGPLVETMLRRSMSYVMEEKEVLVIGAGGISKKFIWEAARNYGIKIHLVESDPGHFASSLVSSFIHYDFEDHSLDEIHAQNVLSIIRGKGLQLSGCMAFWDECTILAALLSNLLELPGPPPSAVRLAKLKTQTQLRLLSLSSPSPPFPYPGAFAVPCFSLGPEAGGLKAAESSLSYPLVVKPESGAGAVGVRLVQNGEECRTLIRKMGTGTGTCNPCEGVSSNTGNNETCQILESCKAKGLAHGSELGGSCKWEVEETLQQGMSRYGKVENKVSLAQLGGGGTQSSPHLLLAEYITGSEHDVDLVLGPNGRLLAAYVSDNGPTLLPGFTETAAALPSRLGHEQRCQLVQAAARCCRALGLFPGVFNVELKFTECGPRLLEINPRMGGFYLRDWIQRVYGTDLVMVALALSCGIEPALPACGARESAVLVGVMCTGERHEEALRSTARPERLTELHDAGLIRFNRLEGGPERGPDQEPYGNVACEGARQKEARERLLGVCAVLGLDTEEYPIKYLTGEFQ